MFKDRLREAIKNSGLLIKEIAFKTNLSQRTIENWLSSRPTIPRADDAVKVAQVLGTTVECLVTGAKPEVLDQADRALFELAVKYHPVLRDLEELDETTRSFSLELLHLQAAEHRKKRADHSKQTLHETAGDNNENPQEAIV